MKPFLSTNIQSNMIPNYSSYNNIEISKSQSNPLVNTFSSPNIPYPNLIDAQIINPDLKIKFEANYQNLSNFILQTTHIKDMSINMTILKTYYKVPFEKYPDNNEIIDIFQKITQRILMTKSQIKNWYYEDIVLLTWCIVQYCKLKLIDFKLLSEMDWTYISMMIPSKTPDMCKFKWLSLFKINLQICPWSIEEDEVLKIMVKDKTNIKWSEVAKELYRINKEIIFRSGKLCRERWNNYLNPNLKKGGWTLEEDIELFKYIKEMGKKWSEISKKLIGRTENAVKNRFNSIVRKEKKKMMIKNEYDEKLNESIDELEQRIIMKMVSKSNKKERESAMDIEKTSIEEEIERSLPDNERSEISEGSKMISDKERLTIKDKKNDKQFIRLSDIENQEKKNILFELLKFEYLGENETNPDAVIELNQKFKVKDIFLNNTPSFNDGIHFSNPMGNIDMNQEQLKTFYERKNIELMFLNNNQNNYNNLLNMQRMQEMNQKFNYGNNMNNINNIQTSFNYLDSNLSLGAPFIPPQMPDPSINSFANFMPHLTTQDEIKSKIILQNEQDEEKKNERDAKNQGFPPIRNSNRVTTGFFNNNPSQFMANPNSSQFQNQFLNHLSSFNNINNQQLNPQYNSNPNINQFNNNVNINQYNSNPNINIPLIPFENANPLLQKLKMEENNAMNFSSSNNSADSFKSLITSLNTYNSLSSVSNLSDPGNNQINQMIQKYCISKTNPNNNSQNLNILDIQNTDLSHYNIKNINEFDPNDPKNANSQLAIINPVTKEIYLCPPNQNSNSKLSKELDTKSAIQSGENFPLHLRKKSSCNNLTALQKKKKKSSYVEQRGLSPKSKFHDYSPHSATKKVEGGFGNFINH